MALLKTDALQDGAFNSFKNVTSIEAQLQRHSGVGPGFDYLRVALALTILVGHTFGIVRGESEQRAIGFIVGANPESAGVELLSWWSGWAHWRHAFQGMLVPMFFALSGFLVTASALRLRNVKSFLIFRGLRILPALTVEVTLSALVLGPVFTSYNLGTYFTDYGFFRYFGNIFGFFTFYLPGVFESNPWPKIVNGNLWTLPAEFYCYLILALSMAAGLLYSKIQYTIFFAMLSVAYLCLLLADAGLVSGLEVGAGFKGSVETAYYFFVGCLFYHWRSLMPANFVLFIISGILSLVLLREVLVGENLLLSKACAPFLITYCTVFLGVFEFPKFRPIQQGDYSYGIYLYGFPIAQAIIATFPVLRSHVFLMLIATLGSTILFAILSWHLFERPTLQLKSRFGSTSRSI